jgi:hypothetical protein
MHDSREWIEKKLVSLLRIGLFRMMNQLSINYFRKLLRT